MVFTSIQDPFIGSKMPVAVTLLMPMGAA